MYDNLIGRLHRYSEACVAYKLDADFASAVQEAADAIEELTDNHVGKWIPVTERLPEKPGNYLVYANYAKGNQPFADVDYYSGKNFATVYTCCGYYRVSHWLPLPEPPEKEEK